MHLPVGFFDMLGKVCVLLFSGFLDLDRPYCTSSHRVLINPIIDFFLEKKWKNSTLLPKPYTTVYETLSIFAIYIVGWWRLVCFSEVDLPGDCVVKMLFGLTWDSHKAICDLTWTWKAAMKGFEAWRNVVLIAAVRECPLYFTQLFFSDFCNLCFQ